MRVSIRALRIEGTFDFSNCSIVQEYNITDTADSQKIIEGKCNEKEFQDAYKRLALPKRYFYTFITPISLK